jgi:cytochrome c553
LRLLPRGRRQSAHGGFARLAGQKTDYLSKQLRDFRAGRRTGTMTATAC